MADDLLPALQKQTQVGEQPPKDTEAASEEREGSFFDKLKAPFVSEERERAPIVREEGYVPPALRSRETPTLGEEVPIGLPSFLGGVSDEIQDTGLAANAFRVMEDVTFEDASDNAHEISRDLPAIMEEFQLPEEFGNAIFEQANSAEHARVLAERAARVIKHSKQRDSMGTFRMLTTGVAGFVGDPTNLIPGLAVVKAAGGAGKLVSKLAPRFAQLQKTKAGRIATWTSFGAVEEAFRNTPRLANDPTYHYEQYLLDVGIGAGFGGGIAAGIPTAQWAKSRLGVVGRALRDSFNTLAENATLRTGVNMASAAAKTAGRAAKDDGLIKILKEADVNAAVRAARDKANAQVKEATVINKVNAAAEAAAEKIRTGEDFLSFGESMKEILDVYAPKGGKLREAVTRFNDWVDARAVKATRPETSKRSEIKFFQDDSVGAGRRKDTAKEKVGDVAADIKSELDNIKRSVKDQIDDIDATRRAALDLIGDATDKASVRTRAAIEASAMAAKRSIEAAAARKGHKAVRSTLERDTVQRKAQERYDATVVKHNKTAQNIESLWLKRGINMRGEVLGTVRSALNDIGIKFTGKDLEGAPLTTWLQKGGDAQLARETVTNSFNKVYQKAEDLNIGNPADKDFLEAKRLLRQMQDEFEAVTDWAGMMQDRNYSDLTKIDPRWALLSEEYEAAMGANREVLRKEYEKLQRRFISKQFGTLTESLSAKLVKTGVPLAEWMALNILELPAGTGGKVARNETAAIVSQMMEADIVVPMNKAWFDMMDEAAQELGHGRFKRAILRTAGGNTHPVVQQISRDVMKYMNAKQMGVTFDAPSYVVKFANKLEEANNKLYDLQLEHSLEGITGHNRMKNYVKQSWNDGAILDAFNDPDIGRDGVLMLLSKSLKSRAGDKLNNTEVRDLAEALLDTKMSAMNKPQVDSFRLRTDNLARSMASIEDIVKKLNAAGKTASIEKILKWVDNNDAGAPGYVHKRFINLDYRTTVSRNGKTISILDLLDNDVIGNLNRYTKEAAGRSAISKASGGRLNSETAINDFIGAVGMQAADMGTYVNTQDIRNVFRQMMGLPYDGQLPISVRKIRDAVSLAGMNGLGESQLAEFGLATNRGISGLFGMNQVASKTVGKIKQWRNMELTPEQQKNTKFLGELQEFSKLYEDMHIMARNNVHFDMREPTMATNAIQKMVETGTGGKYRPTLQYLQTRWTGYGAIRTMEEQVAMAGLLQDAMKAVKQTGSFTTEARFADIGLDLQLLTKKLNDGVIELDEAGNIVTMNLHKWSQAEQQTLGVALRRHAGQQVQMGFAGEMSPLMTNPMVAMLMQFRTYPMLAAEKQQARNLMFADKEAGMGIALNAASSGAARMLRYYSLASALPDDKRERYLSKRMENDFTHDTLQYMGIVGMMVNNWDTAMALGYDGGTVGDQFPVINWADNYIKGVKSVNPVGGYDERDIANMQRGAPLGTIMYVNLLGGVIRNLMETDADESYKYRKTRGS